MVRKTLFVLVLSLPFLLSSVSSADTLRVTDPNDAPGRLDIRAVEHGHGDRPRLVTHRVSVHRPFRTRLLTRGATIELVFSRRPGGCIKMRIMIDATADGLRARGRSEDPIGCGPYDDSGGASTYERLPADLSRPNRRTIVIELRRGLLPGRGDYGWQAETSFRRVGTRCQPTCWDEAPDYLGPRGVIAHEF